MAYDLVSPDGERYTADTADEIVKLMANEKFRPVRSIGSYRKATAKRVKRLFGVEINPSTSETFIKTMLDGKLLFEDQS